MKRKHLDLMLALLLGFVMALAACGGGGDSAPPKDGSTTGTVKISGAANQE